MRIGEASNPGPPDSSSQCQSLSISLINPTAIHQKEDDFLALDTDILCLAETAATKTVQMDFNQALRPTAYRTFWSAPVPDKVARRDPALGQSLRGDNLGTAIMTRIPTRDARHSFPPAVWDTCRVNSVVISTGLLDVLIVSAYFQTGKSAEARIVNNQLLHEFGGMLHPSIFRSSLLVISILTFASWMLSHFSVMSVAQRCLNFTATIFCSELPPTCKGATRFDSMIYHPFLQKYIVRIDIGPEHQFADHCVVRVQFNIPTQRTDSFTWFVPKSWTLFPIDSTEFAKHYSRLRTRSHDSSNASAATCLYHWSAQVEQAVDRTLRQQKHDTPVTCPQGFLPKAFRGRCATPRLIRIPCPKSPKRDSVGHYEPPNEVTSLKSRHKVRQVRRLKCLASLFRKYALPTLHHDCPRFNH